MTIAVGPHSYLRGNHASKGVVPEKRRGFLSRLMFYGGTNVLFLLILFIIDFANTPTGHDPAPYLVLLFALLSFPMFFIDQKKGPLMISVMAGPVFFLFFGASDFLSYLIDLPGRWKAPSASMLTDAELAILAGLSFWLIGYVVGVAVFRRRADKWLITDWRLRELVWFGLICVGLSLWSTWDILLTSGRWEKYVSQGATKDSLLVLARMLELPGAVLLSHAYLVSKSRILLVLILSIAAMKVPMGLMLNSKEIGFFFILIFITTKWLHDGKIPQRWAIIGISLVIFYVPLSYAYRATLGERHLSAAQGIGDFSSLFNKALTANQKTNDVISGIRATVGRVDFKSIVELIVSRVGKDVPYQDGHTLVELPLVFIPRLIMPDKPHIPVGQLFNRELHLSLNPDTYISTSFLGELYWNYSWLGVMLGMFLIGASLGVIGVISSLQNTLTVTRVLILASAAYLLVIKSETGIAQQYALFLRSTVLILVLHFIMRSRRVTQSGV
ncbi:O-antigen polysaccharide polymerase Wzy [Methylocaldum sp. 14B]|jgi:hypothetical protein|uniref:O-antigen polysaccharide polymerase Wzy n=1 Tax=Methylocaldum sp. 14B TaxID=1912213 RepID=UPI00117E53D5|nr:O-antigen polysaccharide polymerase Wzy [Methylocaldum sp. 14B]